MAEKCKLQDLLDMIAITEKDDSEASPEDIAYYLTIWDNVDIYISRKNKKLIGFCFVYKEKLPVLLDVMYIVPKHRGKGLGLELLNQVKADHKHITLISNESRAINFWVKNSFKSIGTCYNNLGYGEHAEWFEWKI